jgi:hypothetical protein
MYICVILNIIDEERICSTGNELFCFLFKVKSCILPISLCGIVFTGKWLSKALDPE